MKATQVYETITNQIIADLEEGVPTWVKPWKTEGVYDVQLPINCATGRPYNGVNVLELWFTQILKEYPTCEWMGLQQAKAAGYKLKRAPGYEPPEDKPWATGQKATYVIFTKPIEREETSPNGEIEIRYQNFATVHKVFNRAQFEPMPGERHKLFEAYNRDFEIREPAINAFLDHLQPKLNFGGNRCYWNRSTDEIFVPTTFHEPQEFYAALFHELTHWAGAPSRLDRNVGKPGTSQRAHEELVAELGAAFLCARFAVEGKCQHSEYIAAWIKLLKNDSRAIQAAASQARQAVEFMLTDFQDVELTFQPDIEEDAEHDSLSISDPA